VPEKREPLDFGPEGTKMRNIVFGTFLFTALLTTGCGSSPLHQSLLMHENRQLENALYAAHAQVTHLKRENNLLRKQQTTGIIDQHYIDSPGQPFDGPWDEKLDFFPPLETPKVILPEKPGTMEVPESLRGSQTAPVWSPRR